MTTDYDKAIQAICDHSVDFVVIGGLAAILHGSRRPVTYDLDLAYSREGANISRLVAALAPFHPRPRGPANTEFIWSAIIVQNTPVLLLQTDLVEIDLHAEVAGFSNFEEVKSYAVSVEAFERAFLTLDLPGLIRAKRAAGREKDLAVLHELESLLEAREP